jgi:hypothetical protein
MQNPILDGYLSEADEAAALGKCVRTLKRWRAMRYGPPVTWIGNKPYYKIESSRAWLAAEEKSFPERRARRG